MTQVSGLLMATPCYGGMVTSAYLLSMVRTCAVLTRRGIRHEVTTAAGDSLVMRARNSLVAVFMASSHSHLLFVDADIEWSPDAVERLLAADKDVICGAYPKKVLPPTYAVNFLAAAERCATSGAIEVSETAAGFMMLRRSVFDRMMAAYPETRYGGTAGLTQRQNELTYSLFDSFVDEHDGERVYVSEDFGFCRRWRAIGGQVWIDPAVELKHHGTVSFSGSGAELQRLADGAIREPL